MRTILCLLIPCLLWAGDTIYYGRSYERAIGFVLAHEGGYCHDGGWESNWGICSKWYPKEDIKGMTQLRAIEIYYRDYWCRMSCQIQPDTNFALLIFDTAVLFGPPTADIMLRNCLYDKDTYMRLRIEKTASIVRHDTAKVKYLTTWIQRMVDLQKTISSPSTKE